MHMLDFFGTERIGMQDDGSYVLRTPVTSALVQPDGIVHGGLSALLAEEAASQGMREGIDLSRFTAVGLDLTSTHLLPVQIGDAIRTVAVPVRQGGRVQVWRIEQFRESDGEMFNVSQMTMYLKKLR